MDVLKTLGTRLLNGWQLSRLSTFEVAGAPRVVRPCRRTSWRSPQAPSVTGLISWKRSWGSSSLVRSHRKVELTREGSAFTGR
ncbi:D-serine dehydratase transcriptional activator [Klebsiella pneumoniae subsp. ozaenae]|uniref:D-serine dehydratase transcriptional activator n=1 Tax=Klebsiella pneumoniae subsp. ozaenae TaxID=574 RepID=A0A377YVC1_KLEPO|nr:D-serine dehydratase transcriptional activator [Klebsiella pneumoniae subsp. ozaenae]